MPEQTLRQITGPFRLGDLSRLETDIGRIGVAEEFGALTGAGIVVLQPAAWDVEVEAVVRNLGQLPAVTVLLADPEDLPEAARAIADAVDICLSTTAAEPHGWVSRGVDELLEQVGRHRLAAYGLVALTRASSKMSKVEGVWAESASYSLLLGSKDYQAWLADYVEARNAKPAKVRVEPDQPVLVDVLADQIAVTLNRPHVRNAVDRTLRDGLVAALEMAESMPELGVELRGNGLSFSAGGDLNEFGQVEDPATAHAVRGSRHPALVLARMGERVTAYVQGPCAGAGVELMAFAGHVVADPEATFMLPEIAMGLIPGAGGTCSLVKRMGLQRANWVMLSGNRLDAPTALAWGLVNEIAPVTTAI